MYIPLLRHTVPNRATECGMPHYQVDPQYVPDTQQNASQTQSGDSIDNYIRESEDSMEQDSRGRMISSGSYNN